MNHNDLFKSIRQGLPSGLLLLHGEEEYVKTQAVAFASETIPEDLRPFNFTRLKKPSVQELAEACETLPLFAQKRIVAAYELADGVDAQKYFGVFDSVPEETVLFLIFKGKLAANSSLLKYAQKAGREVLFDPLSPNECARWCIRHMNESGVLLTPDVARILVNAVGTDMANLVGETDKLISFVGEGGAVTAQDISVCSMAALEVRIFDMLDMFTYGKPGDGIVALHALIDEGSEPMSISAFLVSRFKLMLEARRGIDAKRSKRDVAASMEGNKYANEKAYDAARRFTQAELLTLISELSDTAFMKISGTVKDDKYLELVLLKHDWRRQPV